MITFLEHNKSDYKSRTIENACADMTIAIAIDFSTLGEKCTKSAVNKNNKIYIPISINDVLDQKYNFDELKEFIKNKNIKTINIAGNGIYTLKKKGIIQKNIDDICFYILDKIINDKIELIRSGGQTGVDEAGIKAANKLNIESIILAPKGWKFRDENGKDIYDEKLFKNRFK